MRKKIASWFGRKEHFAGELLGILCGLHLWQEQNTWSAVLLITWFIYYISHKAEKTFYGKQGYR